MANLPFHLFAMFFILHSFSKFVRWQFVRIKFKNNINDENKLIAKYPISIDRSVYEKRLAIENFYYQLKYNFLIWCGNFKKSIEFVNLLSFRIKSTSLITTQYIDEMKALVNGISAFNKLLILILISILFLLYDVNRFYIFRFWMILFIFPVKLFETNMRFPNKIKKYVPFFSLCYLF